MLKAEITEQADALKAEISESPTEIMANVVTQQEIISATINDGGARGEPGVGAISALPLNRLKLEADGLHVSDDLKPDPLSYYILSKG